MVICFTLFKFNICMKPLKEIYNKAFFATFLIACKKIHSNIDSTHFLNEIFTVEWENYELKERMNHITYVLHNYFNPNFFIAIQEIKELVCVLQKNNIQGGFAYLFIPNYVEVYGQEHCVESIASFETITPFVSCEFAIRPFLKTNSDYVLTKMTKWSFHPNLHLRRLASEGCRPRLPWAMVLTEFKKNPNKILPILQNLLNDKELYVRKSVANNLNDISKDHKEVLICFTKKHYGKTNFTNWILKHANRNLLKQAEPEILIIFGFGNTVEIDIQNFSINTSTITLGNDLPFTFDVINHSKKPVSIRLEYAVYYVKKNGTLSKKIFQISEKEYTALQKTKVSKKQHFKPISTRTYHSGIHKIAIIANGKEFNSLAFELQNV